MQTANSRQVGGTHYQGVTQPWDFCIDNKLNPLSFIIVKYLTRWERTGKLQDLEKVEHYMQKMLELVKEGRLVPSGGPNTVIISRPIVERGPLPNPIGSLNPLYESDSVREHKATVKAAKDKVAEENRRAATSGTSEDVVNMREGEHYGKNE